MKKKSSKGAERACVERKRAAVREDFIFIFFLFASFSDLRKSDGRFLSGLKAKLNYATRATRGHQNLGVSSNSTR